MKPKRLADAGILRVDNSPLLALVGSIVSRRRPPGLLQSARWRVERVALLTATSVFTLFAASPVFAQGLSKQGLSKYDVQVHGYATQGFLYTTQNNIYTTTSSDGSAKWTDGVASIGAAPGPKIRVGAQFRYFLFGNYSNAVSLDWALIDYKFNERFGIRAGSVKIASGLFNEVQDIDPAYIWSLLPQSVYPVSSRNSLLAVDGALVYGNISAGDRIGKLEYRGWGGHQTIGPDDGFLKTYKELGLDLPDGLHGYQLGGTLRWKTPLPGLTVGAADTWANKWRSKLALPTAGLVGTQTLAPIHTLNYFSSYNHGKFEGAGEYSRVPLLITNSFANIPPFAFRIDRRNWYVMGSYKVTNKLTAGLYFSEQVNRTIAVGDASRHSKDWALSGRYDFNQYLYLKAEEHFEDGTALGYDMDLNPHGLKPDTRLTILKIGVNF